MRIFDGFSCKIVGARKGRMTSELLIYMATCGFRDRRLDIESKGTGEKKDIVVMIGIWTLKAKEQGR